MSTLPTQVPALIVDAGPIGLTLANLLGREGVDVLLVERNEGTSDLPRAVALDDEGARTLDAAGLSSTVDDITFDGEGSRNYLEAGTCVASVGAGRSVYGFPKRQYFHQPDLERVLLEGERGEQMLNLESLARLLEGTRPLHDAHILRKAIYTFHARVADQFRAQRIMLLGDAAHMTPPFAGQGMNAGLRDTHNVAWKLPAVIHGDASPRLLDSYERERRSLDEVMGPGFALVAQDAAGERALASLSHPV